MSLKFFNLHGHTNYSIGDAIGSVEKYVQWMLKNAAEESSGFAITDHGNVSAAGEIAAAQEKYTKKGAPVKLIYGNEFYFIPDLSEWQTLKQQKSEEKQQEEELVVENEKESKEKTEDYFDPIKRKNHLVVCAYNQKGLENLFVLTSRSYREGFYRKPRIDLKMLKELNEGLFLSTACLAGVPTRASLYARENNLDVMQVYENEIGPLMDIFGSDRFFLELQFNAIPTQQMVNLDLIQFAEKTGFKLIATADCHYPDPNFWKDRDIYKMLAYQMMGRANDEEISKILGMEQKDLECELYLKNGPQMFEAYERYFKKHYENDQVIKQAIERTFDIAHDLVEGHVIPDNKIKLPKVFVPTKESESPFEKLKELALQGLKKKNLVNKKEYVERTIYELKVIRNLKIEEYFLTVAEILNTLRKHMLLGTGRGSGGGSMICYLLNITMVDPIKYNLLFERFISPSRAELPDIDNDLELKEESVEILQDRFGEKNVLSISNYNRLQLKSLIKDLSRLYGVPFSEVNDVTKRLEKEARKPILDEIGGDQKLYELTFEGAKKYSKTFQKFLSKYPVVGEHIENLFQEKKSIGAHAGGVCIVPDAEKHLPIIKIRGRFQSPVSEGLTVQHLQQYFGIPKIDLLGLNTLKIIRRCIELILKNQGIKNPTIDDVWRFYDETLHPDVIDDADQKVMENVYHDGKFPNIFQFAQKPVQKFCMQAKPKSVEEISAITAIFRPGPLSGGCDVRYLGALDEKNKKLFKQEHSVLQEVLKDTRGLLIYQEGFMLLAHKLAGFSLEEANNLRKLLVKPVTALGEELKQKRIDAGKQFIEGCIKNGMEPKRADDLWNKEILGFISYGFCRSHSISYSFNSYQCAYLFTYHEKEWIQACLEKDTDLQQTLNSIRTLGYNIQKPDINYSLINEWFVVDKNCIPSLTSLKGIGQTASEEIIKIRSLKDSGKFQDLNDFLYDGGKWRYSKFNKKALDVLIKMEGFESLGIVGPGKLFKNYKHMHNVFFGETTRLSKRQKDKYITYQNFNLLKDKKTTIDELLLTADSDDWTTEEKIEIQKDIVGFYDKGLVVGKFLPIFQEYEINAIDETEDETSKSRVWAVVEEVKEKLTSRGDPYLIVKVSGISEKPYNFKVWNTSTLDAGPWKEGKINVFSLLYDSDYGYNVPRSCKVLVVNK